MLLQGGLHLDQLPHELLLLPAQPALCLNPAHTNTFCAYACVRVCVSACVPSHACKTERPILSSHVQRQAFVIQTHNAPRMHQQMFRRMVSSRELRSVCPNAACFYQDAPADVQTHACFYQDAPADVYESRRVHAVHSQEKPTHAYLHVLHTCTQRAQQLRTCMPCTHAHRFARAGQQKAVEQGHQGSGAYGRHCQWHWILSQTTFEHGYVCKQKVALITQARAHVITAFTRGCRPRSCQVCRTLSDMSRSEV
eukprot:345090-Pelagomonas_calceolata.AAC.1